MQGAKLCIESDHSHVELAYKIGQMKKKQIGREEM